MNEQQRHWLKQGKLFGYPDCCIEAFIALQHWNDGSPRKLHGTGFIPCVCCNITKTEEELVYEINLNRCKEFKPFKGLEPEMLYMICSKTPGYEDMAKKCRPMLESRALALAMKMNEMVSLYGGSRRFYITPILDI